MNAAKITRNVFLVTLSYAIIRYVVFGTVSADQIPFYIVNKALAYTGLFMLALTLMATPIAKLFPSQRRLLAARKDLGLMGFYATSVHVLITLFLFNPGYYGKFFKPDGHLKMAIELSMILGAGAFAALAALAFTSIRAVRKEMDAVEWRDLHSWAETILLMGGLHVASMGFQTWITPQTWAAGLPPITLWSAATVILTLAVRSAVLRKSPAPIWTAGLAVLSVALPFLGK